MTAKLKIVPNRKLTVSKLELMSCLLLSRLIGSVRKALSAQVKISNVANWSDSKVSLYWVKSVTKKWKIWVGNLVSEIRENVGADCWCYVPTDCNSVNVVTRYNKKLKSEEVLWWKGPSFLRERKEVWARSELTRDYGDALDFNQQVGEVLIAPTSSSVSVEGNICCVIDCERYSSLENLLKVTCFVKRFIRNLKARVGRGECLEEDLMVAELNAAKIDWCKYKQSFIVKERYFEK